MEYELKVITDDATRHIPAWDNFLTYIHSKHETLTHNLFNFELANINCRNVMRSDYIIFNTQEDALLFLLSWS